MGASVDILLDSTRSTEILSWKKIFEKEKLLEKQKDIAKQKLSSKPAKAAETTEKFNPKSTKYSKIFPAKWQKKNSQTSFLSALGF